MSFESDFLALMPDTIIRNAASTALTGYGKRSYSTVASTYSCLVVYEQKLVRALDGTEKVSSHSALIATTAAVNAYDKWTLSDGTVPVVLALGRLWDDRGQHHVEIHFGSGGGQVG